MYFDRFHISTGHSGLSESTHRKSLPLFSPLPSKATGVEKPNAQAAPASLLHVVVGHGPAWNKWNERWALGQKITALYEFVGSPWRWGSLVLLASPSSSQSLLPSAVSLQLSFPPLTHSSPLWPLRGSADPNAKGSSAFLVPAVSRYSHSPVIRGDRWGVLQNTVIIF